MARVPPPFQHLDPHWAMLTFPGHNATYFRYPGIINDIIGS
jgi:hypothetical protein